MKIRSAIAIAFLALALGGCAQLKTVYSLVTDTVVSPTQVIVTANAFDALEGSATQYLVYCKANLATSTCSAANRRAVIQYVRAGRAARNQLETYIVQNANAPSAVYNALVAAVNSLNATPAASGAPK
jgi:hypothetical protein